MSLWSMKELESIVRQSDGQFVSLFMPTHRTGVETRQDPIRLKNLLHQAEGQLAELDIAQAVRQELLSPMEALLKDDLFWSYQADGLALYSSTGFFRSYRVPMRLEELAVVGKRFHVKPLLPLLTENGRFYVMAVSQNEVRLLQCSRFSARDIELGDDVPRSLGEALQYDDPERQLQFHTPSPTGPGRQAATFHGQGVGIDDEKANLLRYFQAIDRGLARLLHGERAPLILACVEYLMPIYAKANSYKYSLDQCVPGNPEEVSADVLRDRAWPIVEPVLARAKNEALERYGDLTGTGRTGKDVAGILPAAFQGRVEVAFLAMGAHVWGDYHPDTGSLSLSEGPGPANEDLLDLVAVETLLHGGSVHAMEPDEMPDGGCVAAILRY